MKRDRRGEKCEQCVEGRVGMEEISRMCWKGQSQSRSKTRRDMQDLVGDVRCQNLSGLEGLYQSVTSVSCKEQSHEKY